MRFTRITRRRPMVIAVHADGRVGVSSRFVDAVMTHAVSHLRKGTLDLSKSSDLGREMRWRLPTSRGRSDACRPSDDASRLQHNRCVDALNDSAVVTNRPPHLSWRWTGTVDGAAWLDLAPPSLCPSRVAFDELPPGDRLGATWLSWRAARSDEISRGRASVRYSAPLRPMRPCRDCRGGRPERPDGRRRCRTRAVRAGRCR